MNNEVLAKIEGGRRFNPSEKVDRIYFNDRELGFEYETYKSSGRISNAEIVEWPYLEGADMETVNSLVGELSNSRATRLACGKHYIDLLHDDEVCAGNDTFRARIEYLIIKAKKAVEAAGGTTEEIPFEGSRENLTKVVLDWFVTDKTCEYYTCREVFFQAWQQNFGKIFVSTDKKYAIVEVKVGLTGTKRTWKLWRVTVDLIKGRVAAKLTEYFCANREGEIMYDNQMDWAKRTDPHFEEKYEWTELKDEPTDPTDPTPTKKQKKLDTDSAVEALQNATSQQEVVSVLQKCKRDTLMELARCAEAKTDVHVRSNASRVTLESTLVGHSAKLVGFYWSKAVAERKKMREIKAKSTEEIVEIAHEVVQNEVYKTALTQKQLLAVCNALGIKMAKSAIKARILAALPAIKKVA